MTNSTEMRNVSCISSLDFVLLNYNFNLEFKIDAKGIQIYYIFS